MEACVLEMVFVLLRRYMQVEGRALAVGSHAHTMVFESLFFLFGLARMRFCARTAVLGPDVEMPDLEPMLSVLPADMRRAICGAIAAEQAGHCHHETTDFDLNVLESHYIWTIEEPPLMRRA